MGERFCEGTLSFQFESDLHQHFVGNRGDADFADAKDLERQRHSFWEAGHGQGTIRVNFGDVFLGGILDGRLGLSRRSQQLAIWLSYRDRNFGEAGTERGGVAVPYFLQCGEGFSRNVVGHFLHLLIRGHTRNAFGEVDVVDIAAGTVAEHDNAGGFLPVGVHELTHAPCKIAVVVRRNCPAFHAPDIVEGIVGENGQGFSGR